MTDKNTCLLCNIAIKNDVAFTQLSCGHRYHAGCLHQKIAHMYAYCPFCLKQTPADGKYDRLVPLNFGDDAEVLSYVSKFGVVESTLGFDQNGNPNAPFHMIPSYRSYSPVYAVEYATPGGLYSMGHNMIHGNRMGKSSIVRSLCEKFFELEKSEKTYGYDIEFDPIKLLGDRVSSVDLVNEKKIDIKSIRKKNISLEYLLENNYTLLDLAIFRTTQQDLWEMNFNALLWKNYKKQMPYISTIRFFRLGFGEILTKMCQCAMERFAWLEFGLEEYKHLHVNVYILCQAGLCFENMVTFTNLSMSDWLELGLNEHIHDNLLQLTERHHAILGWKKDQTKYRENLQKLKM